MATNNSDLAQRRAALTACIAQAREDLNFADGNEIKHAQHVAELRSLAAGKGPRSARRKAAQDAQRFEAKMAKNISVLRAQANALLTAANGELAALPGDEAH